MSNLKRLAANPSSQGFPSKRTKRGHQFGGPSVDDQDPLTSQLTAPSSTALSTRTPPPNNVSNLTTLCARVFVANFESLFRSKRDETQQWLKLLPDAIIPRLFSMLSLRYPTLLSHPLITTFFLRGDPIVLSGDLPGVSNMTVQALSRLDPSLRVLHLTGLDKVSDDVVGKLLSCFPALETLIIRGSTRLGKKTVEAAAKTCKGLKVANLNYTSAPPASIALLAGECLELEVLKLAGVANVTDTTFAMILHSDTNVDGRPRPLACLRCLKLRHTLISDISVSRIISQCLNLSRLDFSFTPIRQPAIFSDHLPGLCLTKLSLTSTPLTSQFLRTLWSSEPSHSIFNSLQTLHIGALGASPSSSISTLAGSLTLTDQTLDALNDVLFHCKALGSISLVGNAKLGLRTGVNSALANFVRKVGRRCKILNLAGIPCLRSSDLAGLVPLHERVHDIDTPDASSGDDETAYARSPLHTLILNNTDIGDGASGYIASCAQLTTLELAGTKFGYDSLFQILDACTLLTKLDLTSCRGVKVGDRRRFFETWGKDRRGD